MTGPFVRLLGDKGLASKYIRNAKQLLAKVHGVRGATGAPIFAMRQLIPGTGALIQAQSFGMIDIITIHAAPIGGAAPVPPEDILRLRSGVVFYHEGTRGGLFKQAMVARCNKALGFDQVAVFNGPWRGPGLRTKIEMPFPGPSLPDPPVLLVDEKEMFMPGATVRRIHAHSYNAEYDFHVVVGAQNQEVFIGGVSVLENTEDNAILGARLYSDQLAVAYLRDSTDLCVRYLPLASLQYKTPLAHTGDDDPFQPALSVVVDGFSMDAETSIFDFDPRNAGKGTFITSTRETRSVGVGAVLIEYFTKYKSGRYEFDGDASSAGDHFTVEQSGEVIHRKSLTKGDGTFSTFTTEYDYPVKETDETMSAGGPGFPPYTWTPAASPEAEGVLEESAAALASVAASSTTEFLNVVVDGGTVSVLPLGLPHPWNGTYIGTATEVGTLDLSYSVETSVTDFPVWTGYGTDGVRYIRKVSGAAASSRTGVLDMNFSHVATYTYSRTSVIDSSSYILGGETVYDYTMTTTYQGQLDWAKTGSYTFDSASVSEATTCTLLKWVDEEWITVNTETIAAVDDSRSDLSPGLGESYRRSLVAPYGERAVWIKQQSGGVGDTNFINYAASRQFTYLYAGAATPTTGFQNQGALRSFNVPLSLAPYTPDKVPASGSWPTGQLVYSDRSGVVQDVGGFGGGVLLSTRYAGRLSLDPLYSMDITGFWERLYAEDGVRDRLIKIEQEFSNVTGDVVNIQEAYVGNRLTGALFVEPLDKHVVSAYGLFIGDWTSSVVDLPAKKVFLVAEDAADVTSILAAAEVPEEVPTTHPPIMTDLSSSDFLDPRGLY